MNRKFENERLNVNGALSQFTFPSLASVCSTCFPSIFPIDGVADFDCTLTSDELTCHTGHWFRRTFLSKTDFLRSLVHAPCWLFSFFTDGEWLRGATNSLEWELHPNGVWGTCSEYPSPTMLRRKGVCLSWLIFLICTPVC